MQVGDLVKAFKSSRSAGTIGVVVKLFEKKIWRTDELGRNVNWDLVAPEPVAGVMVNEKVRTIPLSELELVSESR